MPSPQVAWTAAALIAGALVVAGLTGLFLVRYGPLPPPWAYGALAAAAVGAVASTLLCVARAHGVDD